MNGPNENQNQSGNSTFRQSINGSGYGVQPINDATPPMGGDVHDTFQVDAQGNVSGGHTTARIPGGQDKRMDW